MVSYIRTTKSQVSVLLFAATGYTIYIWNSDPEFQDALASIGSSARWFESCVDENPECFRLYSNVIYMSLASVLS